MAAIPYFEIEESIAEVLRSELPSDVIVTVEEEMNFVFETAPRVFIYFEGREAGLERQRLAAGQKTRYMLLFPIWCWQCSMEVREAMRLRSKLLGEVEIALMKHRDLGMPDVVETSWLNGGLTPSARLPDSAGFTAGGEIQLIAEVAASTV